VLAAADVRDLAFTRDGRLAVAVGTGLRVIDPDGKVLAVLPDAHPDKIQAVAFDPSGNLVASADARGEVRVWKLEPGRLAPQATLSGHAEAVQTLAFSPDGRTLASGGLDRTVILWDPLTGHERAVLTGHADRLVHVQFDPDGSALLTVGRDGSVRRWQAEQQTVATPAPWQFRR
jgi:WD40 repeat protein